MFQIRIFITDGDCPSALFRWGLSLRLIAVYPSAIRAINVRDFFFGIVSRPVETFLAQRTIATEVVNAIADAFYVGANLPRDFLYRLVEKVDSIECWRHLVYIDKALAERIFEDRPELFDTLADAFIEVLPEHITDGDCPSALLPLRLIPMGTVPPPYHGDCPSALWGLSLRLTPPPYPSALPFETVFSDRGSELCP